MKRSTLALLGVLSFSLANCSSDGGPSGGLIGGLTGGILGAIGDEYIGSQENNGSTTIQNANGSTTTIDSNGNVSTTPAANTTNNSVNVTGTGTTTPPTTTPTTTTGTSSTSGNTIITSSNSGSQAWRDHSGLITGAVAGATAGMLTDSFRKKEAERRYEDGYAKAKSDSIKELYWLKRDAQKAAKGGDDPPLQYRYYEVEVPAHTTSDGVLIDRHRRVIEVVE